ncbi:hypothetical protein BD779DRAFT_1667381 [Infundibulicybe gibba]|nr:hypothetical protein BD779DRAFT_1667381 [Infundibulicybe gibba]
MATRPAGEAKQVWDETFTRLLNLSSATFERNRDLENRVAELELELSVWRQAHSVALEASEREAKAHNVQVATLNRQISTLDSFQGNQHPLILCVINGEENIFAQDLLVKGQAGGRAAAQHITKAIAEYLANEDIHIFGRLSFWVTIYYSKLELLEALMEHAICTREQFEAFLIGFSQSSPRFLMVDVGYGQEAVDTKIKDIHSFPPDIAGGRRPMYLPLMSALEKEQLLGKLVTLRISPDTENIMEWPPLPQLRLDGLFMTQRLSRASKKPTPLTVGPFSTVTTNGGLISPQSPTRAGGRVIDPLLVYMTS